MASSAVFCLTAGDPCDDHSVLQIRGSSELNKVTWTSSSWFCHLKRFFSSEVFVCDADVSRCFAPHRVLTSASSVFILPQRTSISTSDTSEDIKKFKCFYL